MIPASKTDYQALRVNGHLKSQYQLRQVIARALRRMSVYVDMAIMTLLALALVLTQDAKARVEPAAA